MKTFYFTFGYGQGHHGYVAVTAPDQPLAQSLMYHRYGNRWSMCYLSLDEISPADRNERDRMTYGEPKSLDKPVSNDNRLFGWQLFGYWVEVTETQTGGSRLTVYQWDQFAIGFYEKIFYTAKEHDRWFDDVLYDVDIKHEKDLALFRVLRALEIK